MTDLNTLTRKFIRLRDKRAELSAEFKTLDEGLKEQMEAVKAELMDYLSEQNVDSVKTEEGTFFRSKKTRYWTSDWEAMNEFILEHELLGFLDKRLNQSAVRAYLEENPDETLPGLRSDTEYTLTVRKS